MCCTDAVIAAMIANRHDPEQSFKDIYGDDADKSTMECHEDFGPNGEVIGAPEEEESSWFDPLTSPIKKMASGVKRLVISNHWNGPTPVHCEYHSIGHDRRAVVLQRAIDPLIQFPEDDTIAFDNIQRATEARRRSEYVNDPSNPTKLRKKLINFRKKQQMAMDDSDLVSGRIPVEGIDIEPEQQSAILRLMNLG